MTVVEAWARVEAWFGRHAPGRSLHLRPPAMEAELVAAEAVLGIRFPDDFRASVLVHDGQDPEPDLQWLPIAPQLKPLSSLVAAWQADRPVYDDDPARFEWLDRGERVRQVHFHPRHIPFAGSTDWDYGRLLFDFVPGPAGTAGQVIALDDIELYHITDSFLQLLERTVVGLEGGSVVPTEEGARYLSPRARKPIRPSVFFADR